MIYREEVDQAIATLKKLQSRFNQIYKHHKLDRDACEKEIQVLLRLMKKLLDMEGLQQAQSSLFEGD